MSSGRTQNYNWILAQFPLCVAVSSTPKTVETQWYTHQDCQKSAYKQSYLYLLGVTQPLAVIWEINRSGDQSCFMDSLKCTCTKRSKQNLIYIL